MLFDDLKKANMDALKERNTDARSILSVVITRVQNFQVELNAKGEELKDSDVLSIIQKVLKELSEEKEGYIQVGNEARATSIDNQIETLNKYLPKQLSEDEIKNIILSLEDKSIPNVMKYFKANYNGQVDMGLVSSVAKSVQ
ncbi:MAG: GatB/YqeY domain-containing protein [Coprobacillus sp.]|nr:GatB/YqeY domain-containing protein [Coprobacillus sp.]